MNKTILRELVKVAKTQQEILKKLAQGVTEEQILEEFSGDEISKYIKNTQGMGRALANGTATIEDGSVTIGGSRIRPYSNSDFATIFEHIKYKYKFLKVYDKTR